MVRGRADRLYAGASYALSMTALTATFVVLIAAMPDTLTTLLAWLAAMLAVVAVRAVDMGYWRPARHRRGVDGRSDIQWFTAGMLGSAALWALFPVLVFPLLTPSQSAATFIVMAAMAGGSATVLGPSLPLMLVYCGVQLLVPGVVFFLMSGRDNTYLGVLALVMFAWLAMSSRQAHRSVVGAMRLSRNHQALVADADRQRRETESANRQLAAAQVALCQSNKGLERRIEERTAALAQETAGRERDAEALARLAATDPLTGLSNRAAFAWQLTAMLREAADAGSTVAVLFLGIDDFKRVNDVRGNAAGDALLLACSRTLAGTLAETLAKTLGERTLLARWGGDEFAVALMGIARATAPEKAEVLRQALLAPAGDGSSVLSLDASIGIATYPEDGQSQETLIGAAGVAMHEAKRDGKGRVRQFDPDLARDLARRDVLEQAMRGGTDRGEFSLVFQPIFDSGTANCDAVEALLRWHPPELGAINTALAIQVAEQTGQITAIGRWVLTEACRIARTWPSPAPAVVVNVSVAQVLSGTLPGDVASALEQSGLPPDRLYLEITESMFVNDPVRIAPVFEAFRRNGHRVLLDDFGTGYSSLAYLGKLPLDVIKIDQTFVRSADQDGYAIIRAILSIARALSLKVTAEGVETEGQRDALTALGVDCLQGYLLAKPMTMEATAAWLAGRRATGMRAEPAP